MLGIALGSSEAGRLRRPRAARITGWLNELAFAPVDYNPGAAADEWSGDTGVGALYFSQQCVFRLAPKVGIDAAGRRDQGREAEARQALPGGRPRGRREDLAEHRRLPRATRVAHYADFYDLKHVLILGRVTSGRGGPLILDGAKAVLAAEFPEIAARVNIQLPDEKSRRVGQSIAAASLPAIAAERH